MKRLRKKKIGKVVCAILQQLAFTTPVNVVYSWGVTNKVATQIKVTVDGQERIVAALMMEVYGFNYCGKLYITLNSAKQQFGLYTERNGMLHEESSNIAFADLGKVLDDLIETGGLSQQEHYKRLREYLHGQTDKDNLI